MKCPHCGSKLEFMVAEDISHCTIPHPESDDDIVLEVLLHCENCTHDWRTTTPLLFDTVLYPKFWG